ncbi:MAG: sulfotransferase family protein [Lysobacterales bacterium]
MTTTSAQQTLPNFFIVGAPKCGTTSMYEYLRQHPQIFFPSVDDDYWRSKEPNHLCPELGIQDKYSIKDRLDYLELYKGGAQAKWRGDASPYYLMSEAAPAAIKALSPAARILVMLRPPVEMMRSYHRDLLRIHLEDVADFWDALMVSADDDGPMAPQRRPGRPDYLDYVSVSRYAAQVRRYQQTFGAGSVKVVLLEDLVAAPATTFRDILTFLQVDESFQPEFRVHNEKPNEDAGRIERLVGHIYALPGVKRLTHAFAPYQVRRRVLTSIRQREGRDKPIDPRAKELQRWCRADVDQLSGLIERDLSHW